MEVERAVTAPAWRSYRTAIVLRSVHPVGKLVVCCHVIQLRRWLVVPRTPGLAAVARYDRPLIAAESHSPRLVGINPQFVVVVSSRRAFECGEGPSAVTRLVRCGIRDVHGIRIFGIHANFSEVPPSPPNPPAVRNALPALSAAVRTMEPALLRIHDQRNPLRIAATQLNPHPPHHSR